MPMVDPRFRSYVLSLILLTVSCAGPSTTRSLTRADRPLVILNEHLGKNSPAQLRKNILSAAQEFMDGKNPKANGYIFEADPIGFVRAAYWQAGIDLFDENLYEQKSLKGMEILYRSAKVRRSFHRKTPQPADLVFFAKKVSASQKIYQVGLVETVEKTGMVRVVGYFLGGPKRITFKWPVTKDVSHDDILGKSDSFPAGKLVMQFARPL